MKKRIIFASSLILILSFFSCKEEVKQRSNSEEEREKSELKLEKIKSIFYTLPSPMDLTQMFKAEGIRYNKELLHNTTVVDEYNTSIKKALNLGVYGADLSFSGLFGRSLGTVEYFTTCQKIAGDLGIANAFRTEYISRLEQNPGDKDTLIQVISDFFAMNNREVQGENHQDISTYILIGGWIEGIHLGTSMTSISTDVKGVKNLVVSQENSLNSLSYLIEHVHKNPQSKKLKNDINELKDLYSSYAAISDSTQNKQDAYLEIVEKVTKIRSGIVAY